VQHQILFLSQATSLMAEHVEAQAESIDTMLVNAEDTRENFGRGNQNIQKAKTTASDFRLCTITLLIFLSFSLLFLHWIH
jgi:t-SNARE complex subunit (syntaxin)